MEIEVGATCKRAARNVRRGRAGHKIWITGRTAAIGSGRLSELTVFSASIAIFSQSLRGAFMI